jgi:hypothetical protein
VPGSKIPIFQQDFCPLPTVTLASSLHTKMKPQCILKPDGNVPADETADLTESLTQPATPATTNKLAAIQPRHVPGCTFILHYPAAGQHELIFGEIGDYSQPSVGRMSTVIAKNK